MESILLSALIIINLLLLIGIGVLMYLLLNPRKPETRAEIEAAMSKSWLRLGLSEQIGQLSGYAQDIRADYKALDQMLRAPTSRGALGEMALEEILADQLDPSMFGIRQRLPNGLIPDAHIRSTVGLICLDSKFALDNFRQMMQADDDGEQTRLKQLFFRNVRVHLDKIAHDYVRPDEGTAPFAFAYIPAEGVYWFLATEGLDMLREYTKRGVQVVSPLTLSHKVALIQAGVMDRKLNEEAKQVRADLTRVARQFEALDDEWRIFYERHLSNFNRKAETINASYQHLREAFDKVSEL